MDNIGMSFICDPEDYEELAKEIDKEYKSLYDELKAKHEDNFSPTAMIRTLTKFKSEQVASLIGDKLSDYDKKILSGVIERHIAGVVFTE